MRMLLLVVTVIIGGLIMVSLVQTARAETILDRLLNIALAVANALVLLVLIGFVFERPAFFGDVGLAFALLAFLFPLAFAKYLQAEGGGLPDWRHNMLERLGRTAAAGSSGSEPSDAPGDPATDQSSGTTTTDQPHSENDGEVSP